MSRLLYICLSILAFVSPISASPMPPPDWENVCVVAGGNADRDTPDTEIDEVSVINGYVYVTVHEPVTVKLFTILGQLVIEKRLAPGRYRHKPATRGIYILKAGTSTQRITI